MITAGLLIFAALAVLISSNIGFNPKGFGAYFLQMLVLTAAAVFYGWLYGKIFEDLPFRALGCWFTKNWFKDLCFGLLIGVLSLIITVAFAALLGGLKFQVDRQFSWSAIALTLTTSLGVFILGAINEEVLFRGYLVQTLARAKLGWTAIILTALFFAAVHLGNQGANVISTLNTALAGIWLGAAYLKTRNLWFPFGIHLMWNWFQGAIFGIEVSGIKEFTTAPLLQEIDAGPAWLTGENYGIEAGIACTVALICSIALIYYLPNLQPTEEMLALTSEVKPKTSRLA